MGSEWHYRNLTNFPPVSACGDEYYNSFDFACASNLDGDISLESISNL